MSNDKVETSCNTDVAANKQMIEPGANGVPVPAATATVRPWTEDFDLPSISFREPKRS